MSDRPEVELLTVEEVADIWKVSPRYIYQEVKNGNIPVVRLGRLQRFRSSDLSTYLDGLVEKPTEALDLSA
jgi:excisionase family DNA binding protein